MEEVLDVYQGRYDPKRPLIGMDEAARQLLSDVFDPLPLKPGQPRRVDDKYDRHGTCSLFMFSASSSRTSSPIRDRRRPASS